MLALLSYRVLLVLMVSPLLRSSLRPWVH